MKQRFAAILTIFLITFMACLFPADRVNAAATTDAEVSLILMDEADPSLDAYVSGNDTYFLRERNLYRLLLTMAPYSRRLDVGFCEVSDEYLKELTPEIMRLFESTYKFTPLLIYNNNVVYGREKTLSPAKDMIYANGVFNRVVVSAVRTGSVLSQGVYSGGGCGSYGSYSEDVNAFDSASEFFSRYEGELTLTDAWKYQFSDSDDAFVSVSGMNMDSLSGKTAELDAGDGKIVIKPGINVIRFTLSSPFSDSFTWYEVYLGVGEAPSIPASGDAGIIVSFICGMLALIAGFGMFIGIVAYVVHNREIMVSWLSEKLPKRKPEGNVSSSEPEEDIVIKHPEPEGYVEVIDVDFKELD